MGKKVFISYNHKQVDWVKNRLVPCLEAGGAEALVDYKKFGAGKAIIGQMDATQDSADLHLLTLTEEYLASDYCQHEMNRAVARDPQFQKGVVLPVIRAGWHGQTEFVRATQLISNVQDYKSCVSHPSPNPPE